MLDNDFLLYQLSSNLHHPGSSGAKSQQRPTCNPRKPAAPDIPRNGNPTLPTGNVAIFHSVIVLFGYVRVGSKVKCLDET